MLKYIYCLVCPESKHFKELLDFLRYERRGEFWKTDLDLMFIKNLLWPFLLALVSLVIILVKLGELLGKFTKIRIQATLHNNEPFCGLWPNYKSVVRFAALDPIINLWAAMQPLALLYNGGPLCGPFSIFGKHPEFGEFTLYRLI